MVRETDITQPYFLSSDIHLPVKLKVISLLDSSLTDRFAGLPLCLTLQLQSQAGHVHSVNIRTSSSTFDEASNQHVWDEWVTFPCKYSELDLSAHVQVVVSTVGSASLFRKDVYFFDDRGRLKRGTKGVYFGGAQGPSEDRPSEEHVRWLRVLGKFERKTVPKVPWLDQAVHGQDPSQRRWSSARKLEQKSHPCLVVEFPFFEYFVLFEECAYNGIGSGKLADASLHSSNLLDRLSAQVGTLRVVDPEVIPSHSRANETVELERNPVENKYYKLARSQLRGLVDPNLKPNKSERERIQAVINSLGKMKREEQNLLWKFRNSLVDNKKALTKLMCCVDWQDEQEVKQATEFLEQWQTFEITDALKLLSGEPEFRNNVVRSHAIKILSKASDDQLCLFLLQLVQALRYDASDQSLRDLSNTSDSQTTSSRQLGKLARFLVDRAVKNDVLASNFHWYMKIEIVQGQTVDPVFSPVHEEFMRKLMETEAGSEIAFSLGKQGEFIDQMLDARQQANLSRKEKVETREKKLRKAFQPGGQYEDLAHSAHPITVPVNPTLKIVGVDPNSLKIVPSNTYPLVAKVFLAPDGDEDGQQPAEKKTYTLMFKEGDDLRQDQLILQLIDLMDKMFKDVNLDLNLTLYRTIATGKDRGLMEFVEDSYPLSKVLKQNKDIRSFFRKHNPAKNGEGEDGISSTVLSKFVKSCAGYCVITYILGIGDRHLDNIMLKPTGQLFHLDFGYIFGREPKPWPVPIRLTKEMIEGMGGRDSAGYQRFKSHCCQAYKVLRSNATLILNLLHLMVDAEIPDLSINQDRMTVLFKIQDKFQLHLSDEEAESLLLRLLDQSADALGPVIMDFFHAAAMSVK